MLFIYFYQYPSPPADIRYSRLEEKSRELIVSECANIALNGLASRTSHKIIILSDPAEAF